MENEGLPQNAKPREIDLTNESDADLLTMISWHQDEEESALAAWGEFYSRYFGLLSLICLRAYRTKIGEAGVEDLVNDTFLRVLTHGAKTFRTSEADPTKLRRLIGIWLGEIAKKLFLMQLRARRRLPEVSFDEIVHACIKATPLTEERQKQCEQLRQVIESLSGRERDVLMARFSNYDKAGGKQQFDPEVLADLAESLQITKDAVRQIFCRAMKKIKAQLSQQPEAR